ncbi:MAG: hypothetical protein PVJ09_05600 [Candidatus Woesebacteria bacterium]|jgi:hypothetical protein
MFSPPDGSETLNTEVVKLKTHKDWKKAYRALVIYDFTLCRTYANISKLNLISQLVRL